MDFNVSDKCPGLADCYGDDFEKLYKNMKKKEKGNISIPAEMFGLKF